jgi:hypothetical protein
MTPQDFDQLSAYIDNQLSPAEKARLEARLEREPDLQTTLADLRLTRRMLRSLPTLKPPRNFTLSRAHAQVAARPRFQLFPALRLATALAGLAFVFVLAVDLLIVRGSGGVAAPAMEQALKSAEPTEAGAAGGAEPPTEAPLAAYPPLAETPTPATAEVAIAAADVSATPTPEAEVSRSALTAPTETPMTSAYDTVTLEAEGTAGYYADEDGTIDQRWPTVRYFEIGLGVLTVLLALAAWWWRNR